MTTKRLLFMLLALALCFGAEARKRTLKAEKLGITVENADNTPALLTALKTIKTYTDAGDEVTLKFGRGTYRFHSEAAHPREMYVSNHDQDQPKRVVFDLEEIDNLTIDGGGALFLFHGRMVPFALNDCEDVTLKCFDVDFADPQIAQVEIVRSDDQGIVFRPEPWVNYRIAANGRFETYGEGWSLQQTAGIAFERDTRHIVYNTGDLGINTQGVKDLGDGTLLAPNWKDQRVKPGMKVAMRAWYRPSPGIFVNESENVTLDRIRVHYAEGMGLLAQRTEDITLRRFGVCLKGEDDPRYFTTQADATHFSQCRGKITSVDGLYEGMMDDAINIHGVYLKVSERIDDYTLRCRFDHGQAWGFAWGDKGDSVSVIRSRTMETVGETNYIASIRPADKSTTLGVREFVITFTRPLPAMDLKAESFGIEDLAWTPEVLFSGNTVRNNRARGALFSSPRRTVCEDNLFDHTSGTAILLCGDCNGWYESGAVRDLVIRRNTFINALTSQYQFTNAVISIYPEIPQLKEQKQYFHGGKFGSILIENNTFDTFDAPLLYAKSVDGLIFRNNTVKQNTEYAPMHWNKKPVWLERCRNTAAPGYVEHPQVGAKLLEK